MDTILSRYAGTAASFIEEQEAYKARPTKASSKRLRALSQQLSNLGSDLRKELVAADKAS